MNARNGGGFHPVGEAALVKFFCMRPAHHDASGSASDHLTIHERSWAYCPRDARLGDHLWEQTGGIAAQDIERFARDLAAKKKAGIAGGSNGV
jgi:hypothetical protein